MEVLSQQLQPFKGLVGSVASVVTIAQFFTGVVICKDIYKNKSTHGTSSVPFIGGVVIGLLMLQYALMLQDNAMLIVNAAAVALNILYSVFYFNYSQNKRNEVYKPLSCGIGLTAFMWQYSNWEDPTLLEYRYGLLVTIFMLLLMGSPLLEINEIIRKKDASSIPLPLALAAFFVTFLWMIYGIILLNYFMIVQNCLGLILCAAQVTLYVKYPKKTHVN